MEKRRSRPDGRKGVRRKLAKGRKVHWRHIVKLVKCE